MVLPREENGAGGGGRGEFSWLLTTEEGNSTRPCHRGKTFTLPAKLPEGYHSLTLTQDEERCTAG
ncbi:hypothetical protein ACNKHO_21535 [Shigella flexneri]